MKKPVVILLGATLLFTGGAAPAFAQLVKAGEGAKAVAEIIAKTPAKQTIKEMVIFACRLPTSPIMTQDVAYIARIEQWALANYGAEAAHRLTVLEKVQLMENRAAYAALPKQEVIELFSNPQKLADIAQLNDVQKEYFYITAFPERVLEGGVVPSKEMLEGALAYTRGVVLEGVDGSLDAWARQMGAITNLGLFGTAQDAQLIVDSAKQVTGAEKGVTDVIAVRALVNILGLDAYKYVRELLTFRLQATDSLGNPEKLSYAWRDLSVYMDRNGLPLDIPKGRISSIPVMGITRDAEQLLGKYNAYNLYNKEAAIELTEKFKELRGHVQTEIRKAQIQEDVGAAVRSETQKGKNIEQAAHYESPFASFRRSDWEIAQEAKEVQAARETQQRQILKPATYATSKPSRNELEGMAINIGIPTEQMESLSYQELSTLIAVTENMLKKVPSRFDAYIEEQGIDLANSEELREELMVKWAKEKPDFVLENYRYDYRTFNIPFNYGAKNVRVLLINDDKIYVNEILRANDKVNKLLEAEGKTPGLIIETTNSIKEGREFLRDPNRSYDLVMTDFNTVAGNAYELAMQVFKDGLATKVVTGSKSGCHPHGYYAHGISGDVKPELSAEQVVNYLSNIAVTGHAFPKP